MIRLGPNLQLTEFVFGMNLREIRRSHYAVRSTILTDAMSPGIRERKDSKKPKEDFWKGSLHHKCVHNNGCGTLDYRL
jgi:hypothetical protein